MNNITREDIAEFINNEFGLTKKDCINLVNDIIEEDYFVSFNFKNTQEGSSLVLYNME